MDQNLYIKMAAATKFFDNEHRLAKRQKMLDKEIEKLEREYAEKKQNEKDAIYGGQRRAIIALVVGIIGGILWLMLLALPVISGDMVLKDDDVGFVIAILLICSSLFLCGLIKTLRTGKRKKNFESKYTKIWEELYRPQYSIMEKEMDEIEAKIKKMHSDFGEQLAFLPKKYQNLRATSFLLMAIKDGRADTLKEAYNLYEEQLHRWKLEDAANQAAEKQRIVAMAMDELSSQMAETNAHLDTIEQMEYFKYLHGKR